MIFQFSFIAARGTSLNNKHRHVNPLGGATVNPKVA